MSPRNRYWCLCAHYSRVFLSFSIILSLFCLIFLSPKVSNAGRWRAHTYTVEDFSITYPGHDLPNAHNDAYGFLMGLSDDYDKSYFTDRSVQRWQFDKGYDDWGGYGIDSAHISFTHTHGFCNENSASLTMGDYWYDSANAYASNFKMGDQNLRYFFAVSCSLFKQEYIKKHWIPRIAGTRMLFGFNSTAYDYPTYGYYFFDAVSNGATFKDAWLDASYKTTPYQSPIVIAAGSSKDDAILRREYEKSFDQGAVGHSWFAWTWRNSLSMSQFPEQYIKANESDFQDGDLFSSNSTGIIDAAQIMDYTGLPIEDYEISARADGSQIFKKRTDELNLFDDPSEICIAGSESDELLLANTHLHTASELASGVSDGTRIDLRLNNISQIKSQEASIWGEVSEEKVDEIVYQYATAINDYTVVTPDSNGYLEISVNPTSGDVNWIKSSLTKLPMVSASGKTVTVDNKTAYATSAVEELSKNYGVSVEQIEILNEYSGIGYEIKNNEMHLVFYFEAVVDGNWRTRLTLNID